VQLAVNGTGVGVLALLVSHITQSSSTVDLLLLPHCDGARTLTGPTQKRDGDAAAWSQLNPCGLQCRANGSVCASDARCRRTSRRASMLTTIGLAVAGGAPAGALGQPWHISEAGSRRTVDSAMVMYTVRRYELVAAYHAPGDR
jgi:hypothetical protein